MLPIKNIKLPKSNEPGSFGAIRKFDIHTGVDLYCEYYTPVYAIEDGYIKRFGQFTGKSAGSPWWKDTDFILIQGKSGCILYGEIEREASLLKPMLGEFITAGTLLGYVIPVLKIDKGRPMNMLHIELYSHDYDGDGVIWNLTESCPDQLWDITPVLKREINRSKPFFKRILGYLGIDI